MTKKTKNVPRNSTQYTHLCSEYIIPASDILDKISNKAHDLYNRALYDLRQGLFHKQYVKGYNELDSMFKKRYQARESMLYHELAYVQSAQQTLKEVNTVWQAWFKANKAYQKNPGKFTGKPRIPKYLRKKQRHTFFVTNQNAKVKDGYLTIPKLKIKVKLAPQIKQVQISLFIMATS